jgi:hypothetical protein
VTNGEFDIERLVATPAQALRAAMRLYELGLGLSGFVLCLMDFIPAPDGVNLSGNSGTSTTPSGVGSRSGHR